MSFNRFLPDYGVLPSAYFERSTISNPMELFWSDDLRALLRLCGAKEETIGDRASDYDRFLSLCRALPLLEGHPTRAWISSVLKNDFNLHEPPTKENAPAVWKQLCDRLLEHPILTKKSVSGDWLCDRLTIPSTLPQCIAPVLNGNLLLNTNAKNTNAWGTEIAATVAYFAANKCQKVVLHLQNGFDFVAPSSYAVDRALSHKKRNCETIYLLTCQLMRELCVAAQKSDLLLVLVCNDNSAALARLLQYAEESVGLPRICWSVREVREAHELLQFTAKTHKNEIFAALPYESVMTECEISNAVESWQVRYPIGRLCFVTACDLRQMPHAQAHIADMLKKAKTNI